MPHTCHASNCRKPVPPEMFTCKPHWFALPKPMRDRIWRAYRAGQCDDMNPSNEYCEAAKAAVIFLANRDQVTPDVELYDLFLKNDHAV